LVDRHCPHRRADLLYERTEECGIRCATTTAGNSTRAAHASTSPLRKLLTSRVVNQDTVAWVGQGAVTDRENEHLGESDRGVILLRRQLRRDMEAVQRGEDPKVCSAMRRRTAA